MNASNLKKPSETDWDRIDKMKDEDINTSDIPPLDEAFFANAKLRMPAHLASVKLEVSEKQQEAEKAESAKTKQFFSEIPQLEFIHEFETQLSLPNGFYNELLAEDDWSFIIKLHSLLEAAVTHLLVERLSDSRLEDIFVRLELSNLTTGKLAFADKLDLLDKESKRFIQKVSEIRNDFVHDVKNVNIKLDKYFPSLKESEYKGFLKAFKWGHKDEKDLWAKIENNLGTMSEVLKLFAVVSMEHSPKIGIWAGSMVCMREIHNQIKIAEFKSSEREILRQIAELLDKVSVPHPLENQQEG